MSPSLSGAECWRFTCPEDEVTIGVAQPAEEANDQVGVPRASTLTTLRSLLAFSIVAPQDSFCAIKLYRHGGFVGISGYATGSLPNVRRTAAIAISGKKIHCKMGASPVPSGGKRGIADV